MSGVYAYCVTRPLEGAPDVDGIEDAPVFVRTRAGLGLWLSAMEERTEATLAAVRRHNAVVEAAWRTQPACVPFRFGQWFRSSDAADTAAGERSEELREALAKLEGMVEFGVRVVERRGPADASGPEPAGGRNAAAGPGPGKAYMEKLRRRHAEEARRERRAAAAAGAVREALAGILADERSTPGRSTDVVAELAHLVPRATEARYRSAVRTAGDALPDVALLVTGPWPPYSFGP